MNRRDTVLAMLALSAAPIATKAQQPRVYRVGVILQGNPYLPVIDGLRHGLKDLGLEDGNQVVFHMRNTEGDLKSVETAATTLEKEKVDLIYAVATSVALATKRATTNIPIVFYAASDPVAWGLIESYRKPGGRLTGFYGQYADATAKRLEILKLIIPRLGRMVTFYNPDNVVAQRSVKLGRDAARQFKVVLVERPVTSVEKLRTDLRALKPGEVDAFFYVGDAMITSQAALIIEAAKAKRLPTMFSNMYHVKNGALAAYGENFHAIGQLSARHIQRILLGTAPGNLPVEQIDNSYFAINLKTAKEIDITIPQSVLARADEVIQ